MQPTRISARQLLLLGIWFGLVGGLAEALVVVLRRTFQDTVDFRGLHIIWTAPASLALLCTLGALPLAGLSHFERCGRLAGWSVGLLALVASFNWLDAIPAIHPLAAAFLALGLAIRCGMVAASRPDRLLRMARVSVIPLLALLAVLGFGTAGLLRVRERQTLAGLRAPVPGAPSILLLMLDTSRALDLSLYGYHRRTTPSLDSLGQLGIVFERAYATSSWTLPSQSSIFTGHLPQETRADWSRPLDATYPTLAEVLGQRGYATAGFSANLLYVTRQSGLARGFAHFEDHHITFAAVATASSIGVRLTSSRWRSRLFHSYQMVGRKSGHQLGRDALEWLATVPADRPYFAFLNFFDAHAPYLPAAPFDTLFSGRRRSWAERNPQLYFSEESTPQADVEREAYDQALASQDHDLGTFLAQCRARGLLRNTIIVITADHGEEFGEWGLLDHGLSLHPAALRVPLVVILAGRVPEGIRIAAPVSLLNLAATILALADSGASRELPGTPLPMENIEHNGVDVPVVSELEKGVPQQPEWFPVSDGPLRAVTTRRWHYIRDARGRETLMDLSVDPAGRLADPSDSLSFQARAALRAVLGALGPLRTAP